MESGVSTDREKWLAERRRFLGGTDMAKILGASEWGGPLDVWLDKVKGVRSPSKWIMDLGNLLEEPAAQLWVDRRGLRLAKPDAVRHPEFDFLGGSPDFLCLDDLDLGQEVKTASSWGLQKEGKWGEDGSGLIPLDYWVQCQWYMGLTGRRRWELGAAFYDVDVAERLWPKRDRIAPDVYLETVLDEFRVYQIEFDPEFFAMGVEEGRRFWEAYIEPFAQHGIEIAPPMDGNVSKLAREWALGWVSRSAPKVWTADEATEALFLEHLTAASEEKAAKARKDAAKEKLEALLALHEAQTILGTTRKIKLSEPKDAVSEDTEAVVSELAGLMGFSPEALGTLRRRHQTTTPKAPDARVTDVKVKKETTKASKAIKETAA